MRLPHLSRRTILLASLVVVLLAPLVGWSVDSRRDGEVAGNVELAGESISGLDRAELTAHIAALAAEVEARPVVVVGGGRRWETTAGEIGVHVDVESTVDAAFDAGRNGFFDWLAGFVRDRRVDVALTVDAAEVEDWLDDQDADESVAREPALEVQGGRLVAVDGRPGVGLAAEELVAALERLEVEERSVSEPWTVEVEATPVAPRFTLADAEALAREAERMIAGGVAVAAGTVEARIDEDELRSWLSSRPGEDRLELVLDAERAAPRLAELLAGATTEPTNASITVTDGRPVVVPGSPGTSCCADDAVDALLRGLRSTARPIALPLRTVEPEVTTEEMEALGIVEEVASFTTRHNAGEPRVQNIHRIADIVRGTIIRPGELLSINQLVGQRTVEKGFVPAPAIVNGNFGSEVGGGISQFMTTFFNAAFFAGLEFGEYQSHTIYISRYPYGREATINWPRPDFQVRNNTPYGVLVWPTYTNSSITVTLYSTRVYASVEQTGQRREASGQCTAVTTERTRVALDGTRTVDTVKAFYRPGENLNCQGQPIVTTTTRPPTTTVPPESTPPTTTAPAETAPTTAPATTPPTAPAVTTAAPAGGEVATSSSA